jgi:hypothetical protein
VQLGAGRSMASATLYHVLAAMRNQENGAVQASHTHFHNPFYSRCSLLFLFGSGSTYYCISYISWCLSYMIRFGVIAGCFDRCSSSQSNLGIVLDVHFHFVPFHIESFRD